MFELDQVVPWGRSLAEYQRMFALTAEDAARRIVGCGDGPASFNAEATRLGARVVSCDPLYHWSGAQIDERIAATAAEVLDQTRRNAAEFVWARTTFASVEELGEVRMRAMRLFLDDYGPGKAAGRYGEGSLPSLPFVDGAFDLALSSHLLFLYSAQLDETFHRAAIREMCRVAGELRIFPLLALDGRRSPFVDACLADAQAAGHDAAIERVPYEFQRGGNEMLRIRQRSTAADRS